MKKLIETAVILVGTIGWWGFVYPELCLTQDVYEQAYEDAIGGVTEENSENRMPESENKASKSGNERPEVPESEMPKEHTEGAGPSGIWESIWAEDGQPGWQIGKIRIKSRLAEYILERV